MSRIRIIHGDCRAAMLDITCGSGSTLKAAAIEGFDAIGCETDARWVHIAAQRAAANGPLLVNVTVETAA